LSAQRQTPPVSEDQIHELPERLQALRHDPRTLQILEVGLTVYSAQGLTTFLSTPLAEFGGQTGLQLAEHGQPEPVLAALAADLDGLSY
jgi:hypothetical protein